jgi:cytochrome c-type biogenesis protein CcmH/NrfG
MGKKQRKQAAGEEAAAPAPGALRRYGLPAGLALAVGLAFSPVLAADFVNWDDDVNFLRNPFYRGLWPSNLWWMFTTPHMGHYQPLAWVTLGADYVLWGMDPRGYHFTNLLLHATNTVLCYFVFLGLLRRVRPDPDGVLVPAAALGALFYGLHPLRVESVAWVTERRDVLCGLFFLLSILAYLRMVRARSEGAPWKKWLALSCAAFAASLLSKALGIMLPFMLLAMDVYPLRRFAPERRRAVLLEKLPYLALAVADGLVMIWAMRQIGQVREAESYALGQRLIQSGYSLWFYPWKTLLPFQLHALYALGDNVSLVRAEYVWPMIGAAAVTAGLVALRRRWPAGLAAWACYVILLTPVLGLFVKGYQRAADRYSYLSCLPLSFLAAAGVAALFAAKQSGGVSPPKHRLAVAGIAAALGVLGVLTYVQAGYWKDSITLFDRVLAFEQRTYLPYVNRGSARMEKGDLDGALADFSRALVVDPRNVDAFTNRGKLRHERGDLAGALADYNEGIALEPRNYEALNNRASLNLQRGDLDGALADVEQALLLRNYEPEPYGIRAHVRLARGDAGGAIADCEAALKVARPGWPFRKQLDGILERARKLKAGK